jgi:hypothetical protein
MEKEAQLAAPVYGECMVCKSRLLKVLETAAEMSMLPTMVLVACIVLSSWRNWLVPCLQMKMVKQTQLPRTPVASKPLQQQLAARDPQF